MSEKKKIVFIATAAYTVFNEKANGSHGGMELQLSYIAKDFAKNKKEYDVGMLVGNYGQEKYETKKGVKLIKTVTPKAKSNILIKGVQAAIYFYNLILVQGFQEEFF